MKNKKDLEKLAKEIADIELKLQSSDKDKDVKSLLNRIEIIMESLSLKEGLELNDAVLKILQKI